MNILITLGENIGYFSQYLCNIFIYIYLANKSFHKFVFL